MASLATTVSGRRLPSGQRPPTLGIQGVRRCRPGHRGEAFDVRKRTGKVAELEASLPAKMPGTIGIAHTRWATHGGVTDENAHPHLGPKQRVVIVHNGIIENASRIRKHLERTGASFRSETDSEVIAHRLERAVEKGQSPISAMRTALKGLRGTWGVCALFLDHDELVCARNGSPMVIGETDHGLIVTSDPQPLVEHTDRIIILEDGDIAAYGSNGLTIERLDGGQSDTSAITLEESWGEAGLGDHPLHAQGNLRATRGAPPLHFGPP